MFCRKHMALVKPPPQMTKSKFWIIWTPLFLDFFHSAFGAFIPQNEKIKDSAGPGGSPARGERHLPHGFILYSIYSLNSCAWTAQLTRVFFQVLENHFSMIPSKRPAHLATWTATGILYSLFHLFPDPVASRSPPRPPLRHPNLDHWFFILFIPFISFIFLFSYFFILQQ